MLFHTCLAQVQIGWIFLFFSCSEASPLSNNLVNPRNLKSSQEQQQQPLTPSEREIRMTDSNTKKINTSGISCFQYHDETGQLIVNNCLTENSGTETIILVLGLILVIGSVTYFIAVRKRRINSNSGPSYSITQTKEPDESISQIVKERLESSSNGSVYDNNEKR